MELRPTSYRRDGDWMAVATIVDRFEQLRSNSPEVGFQGFLPNDDDPLYAQAAAELIRVDMELRWSAGDHRHLSAYREVAPKLFEDIDSLAPVAYEEYRLRRQLGEQVSPDEYSKEYGVATDTWPVAEPTHNGDACHETACDYPRVGEEFAGFRLQREIGRGSFARVYLAEQHDLAWRNVVLKLSHRRSLEPEHLARLQHTNIVPIYSVHEEQGLLAVCMPYFGEQTLASLTQQIVSDHAVESIGAALVSTVAPARDDTVGGSAIDHTMAEPAPAAPSVTPATSPRPATHIDFAIRLVRDVSLGLGHAHACGIVHRDLKPANILLADDGRPMLLDFNLSDDAAVNGLASLTVGGTLPYLAPEHLHAVLHGGEVDPRADLYSVGVILFELLTGRRPFPDRTGQLESTVEQSIRDRQESVPSARSLNPFVSPSIDALLAKCLTPSPEERYQTAEELADDLTRHLEDFPLRHAPNPSLRERTTKWRRRHPRLTSAGSVAAVAMSVVALFAGLWLVRGNQVAQLKADQHYHQFLDLLPQARLALSLPESDRALLTEGLRAVEKTTAIYRTEDGRPLSDNALYERLSPIQQQQLCQQLAELRYLEARAERIIAAGVLDSADANERLERALRHNQMAIDLVGSNSRALIQQHNSLVERLGREDKRLPPPAIELSHQSLDDYLAAQQLIAEGDYAAAVERLAVLRDRYPTDPVIWTLLGSALGMTGDRAGADAAFTVAASLEPRSYLPLYSRGQLRLQQRDALAAIADFDEVLAIRPGLACALLERALAYEAAGEFQLALADLDAAIATKDAPPRALLLRSRVRQRLGDADGAEVDRQAGIAAVPWDETGWVARGVAKLGDDPEGALADFQRALELNLHSVLALRNILHVTSDRLNRPDEALSALDAWLEIEPANPNAFIGRAVLQARLDRRDESIRDVEEALKHSREPVILFQAACAYSLLSKGDPALADRGLTLLGAAIERAPGLRIRALGDPDLDQLRTSELFEKLMDAYQEIDKLKHDLMKPSIMTQGSGSRY